MGKRERERKKAERMARFLHTCEDFAARGYTARDCTFSTGAVPAVAYFTFLPMAALWIGLYAWLVRTVEFSWTASAITAVTAISSIPVHELLHAFGWAVVNRSFRCVRLGFDAKTLTPYCACFVPMSRGKYLTGCLAPYVVLGILPCVFALAFANAWLLAFGVFGIIAACGDTAIAYSVLRKTRKGTLLLDHPERAGCYAFSRNGTEN